MKEKGHAREKKRRDMQERRREVVPEVGEDESRRRFLAYGFRSLSRFCDGHGREEK